MFCSQNYQKYIVKIIMLIQFQFLDEKLFILSRYLFQNEYALQPKL